MGEDHSKYMPHHPKPKFAAGKGKPSLKDPGIRARSEPTSHDGSGFADGAGYMPQMSEGAAF